MAYLNPEDQLWGDVANGTATGHFKGLLEGKFDLVIGGMSLFHERMKVPILQYTKCENMYLLHSEYISPHSIPRW